MWYTTRRSGSTVVASYLIGPLKGPLISVNDPAEPTWIWPGVSGCTSRMSVHSGQRAMSLMAANTSGAWRATPT